jgi:Tfp pilus assembly protein PilO
VRDLAVAVLSRGLLKRLMMRHNHVLENFQEQNPISLTMNFRR